MVNDDLPYLLEDDEEPRRRKKKPRSRFLHSCGVYSLCISIFYMVAFLVLMATNPPESSVDASLDLVEASLGITGVIISMTFLQARNRRHLLAIGCSWLVWMIASFLLSVCALHQLIVEVVSGNDRELLRVAVDTVLTINAPVSIYFILLFASSGGRARRRRKARKQLQRRQQLAEAAAAGLPQGLVYDQFGDAFWANEACDVEADDDETVVYYV
ncbi:hypothetical protein PENTCL1PPCAC_9729 [Pristionchus entomophagus]|uniref:Uncharacterized protein n=1 Tax=Pristionchus entomophagus TaxID=358040 RepID=A0AAV5T1U6_9BILA|nr:hypothetical protein PENTCL1PPCAC_9729 [Pristionchus entomophagus]